MEIYYFFAGFILVLIVVNTMIYFYLKYKRKLFFKYIKDKKYTLIPNVKTEIEAYSKIGAKISYRKADIILLDDNIFLLTFNKPIIQLTINHEVFPSVYHKHTYSSKTKMKNRLEIRNLDGSLKVNLNFKNKDFDLELYLNEFMQ